MKRLISIGLALTVAAVAAACGSTSDTTTTEPATSAPAPAASTDAGTTAPAAAPIKAAWIFVGPHDDHGWSQAHDTGRQYVQDQMGDAVVTTFKENVPEPEVAPVIDQLIADGNKIIFATSFGYQDAMVAAAAAHPDVYFEMATGYKTSPNMAVYFGAGEDAIYLSGMAAGAATKSGTIGYIVPFPIPEVVRHANAFTLGAQKTHPGAKVKVVWTKSWFAPDVEAKAAEGLIAAGADVIGQNVDSPAGGQVSEKKSIPWVGYDSDATTFAPTQWLTAAVYNWGPYYLQRTKAAADGTWATGAYYGSIADGFTDIAPFGPSVSQETKDAIESVKQELVAGTFYEFQGPLKDQDGKERVAEGAKMSLEEILAMDWFVAGMEGSPKG